MIWTDGKRMPLKVPNIKMWNKLPLRTRKSGQVRENIQQVIKKIRSAYRRSENSPGCQKSQCMKMINQVFKDVTREVDTLTISNLEFFIQFSKLQLFFFCPNLRWPYISRLATTLECIKDCQYNFHHSQWSAFIHIMCGIMKQARKHQTGHLGALHKNGMIILNWMLETFGFKMWIDATGSKEGLMVALFNLHPIRVGI